MTSLIELLAVLSGGTFGILLARKKQMDFVGVFSIALATAFGGGTLRDLFLDRHPLFWIENHHYPVIIFSLSLLFSLQRRVPGWVERILPLPDALGLGLFSVAGVSVALDAGCSLFIAALMGVITGTFGGVIGDVVCNEIPSLFSPHTPLYATCSFLGCWGYLLLRLGGLPEAVNMLSALTLIVVLRLLALRYDWRLPKHEA
ncbi:MAG: trimeric intracellular cation channel family protein [Planctomycetaceae bacterium]|nr:trimeric intracellular cation channel family protein [Planctomycetaceae bacterium]